jgi:thiamine biosynthesis protein ThiI
VTSESLGQVASQTLDNLMVLDDAASIPVYRPLIGFDKEEIIRIAREIGTFPESVSSALGCRVVPHGTSTAAKRERIRKIEADLLLSGLPG